MFQDKMFQKQSKMDVDWDASQQKTNTEIGSVLTNILSDTIHRIATT